MYSIEEFKSATAAHDKRFLWRIALIAGILVLLLVPAGIAFRHYGDDFAEWYVRWVTDLMPLKIGLLVLLIGVVALSVLVALPLGVLLGDGRTARRDARLWCPHCHQHLGSAAVATGNCGWCGKPALEHLERSAEAAGTPSVSVEEFKRAVAVARKRTLLGLGAAIFWFFAWFGLLVATKPLIRDPWLAWLGAGWTESDAMFLLALPAFAGLFGGMGLLALREMRGPRDPRMTCPGCQAHLEDGRACYAVVATRRCYKCETLILADPDATAQRVLNDPIDQALYPPLLSLGGFRQANSAHSRWILFF